TIYLVYTYQFSSLFSNRRRHTKSKRDWSSDVCSSDLFSSSGFSAGIHYAALAGIVFCTNASRSDARTSFGKRLPFLHLSGGNRENGRASCREREKLIVV